MMNLVRNQRRFQLVRKEDETGVSGEGIVGEGCLYSDGSVSVRWMSENPSGIWYGNITSAIQVHGHKGKTVIKWLDPDKLAIESSDVEVAG